MGKMIDLGKKYPAAHSLPEVGSSTDKPSVSYPSMYVDGKHEIPGKVGGVIHAKVKLRKTSHTIRKEKDGTTHSHGFDVMAIDPGNEDSQSDNDVDDAMDEQDHMDGGRVNSQSQIEAGLDASEKKGSIKTQKGKKG